MQEIFMGLVCPQQGYIHIKGLGHNANPPLKTKYKNFANVKEAVDYANSLSEEGYDTYFCTASLKNADSKKELKSFCASSVVQFDVDVQEDGDRGRKYTSLEAARTSMFAFLRDSGLPKPTLVTSGYGIHAYYVFDRDISYNEKTELCKAFVKLARDKGFKLDAGATHDVTKLLRVPGTKNYKNGDTKDVQIRYLSEPIDVASFRNLLQIEEAKTFLDRPPPDGAGDLQGYRKILREARVRSWPHILQRSLQTYTLKVSHKDPETGESKTIEQAQSKGCEQIRRAMLDQPGTQEPIWKGVLGIIMECSGSDEEKIQWAVEISEKDPDRFDREGTIKKLYERDGYPTTCAHFKLQDEEPCRHCEFAHRPVPMASPLQLSQIYAEATPEDNIIEIHADDVGGVITVNVPDDYPPPYFRSKAGGVIYRGLPPDKKIKKSEEEETVEDTIIYQRDFWLHRRVEDLHSEAGKGGGGAVGHWMHITPNDGLKEIIIPAAWLAKQELILSYLQSHSIHVVGTKGKLLINYMNAFMEYDQTKRIQLKARDRFGWHDDRTKFLIGKREIDTNGQIEFSPVCKNLETLFPYYNKTGSLDKWKSVINTYNNKGNEVRAFALFLGIGTPLYSMLNIGSSMLHLTNPASGVGKSTILMCINSVYGHPNKAMLSLNDTALAIQSRMASMSNLPLGLDETTNITPDGLSDLSLIISHNRGRNRMQAHVNAERKNEAEWQTILFSSGNNSHIDILKAFKTHADGERMRIMELFVPKDDNLTKEEADDLFHDTLPFNYGIAGELFMIYVMQNLAVVEHRLKERRRQLDRLIEADGPDRYHSAMIAVAITAGEIADELGLHNIDVKRVEKYILGTRKEFKKVNKQHNKAIRDAPVVMGTLLSHVSGNMIVVDGEKESTKTVMNKGYYRMPHGEVCARYEKATGIVAVAEKQWLEFCTAERVSVEDTIRDLTERGIYLGVKPFDLTKGTDLPPMKVSCIVFKHDREVDA
jgi:hypothetical protein